MADAVRRLGEAPRVGALVVTSDRGRVIGLVGEREIVRGLGDHGPGLMQSLGRERDVAQHPDLRTGRHAGSVMRTMTESRFRHIPVMDGNDLAGLVSIGDESPHLTVNPVSIGSVMPVT